MQTYEEVLTYAIPFFIILILIEYSVSRYMNMEVVRSFDTVSSLSSGLTNSLKEVLGLAVVIVSYEWMVDHMAILSIRSDLWLYVLTFIGLDFAGYWTHRFEHEINLLWNRHIIHHSSEEYNLACALRQNVSAILGIFFFLLLPLALIGIPVEVIAVVAPLHLFAQFWYHTRLIDKMGWLEYILVTPSHHRVHHAINDEYLDRNYSQVFIIWDHIFGTFQPELTEVSPVYGVKKQVNTWNPFLINFQHLWILLQDAWHTKSWMDKLRVFYMPTGWRPSDRLIDAPITYTIDPNDQIKYTTTGSLAMHIWIWAQFIITTMLMLFMFQSIATYSFGAIIVYGVFLAVSIFAYTSLMDHSPLSIVAEIIKVIIGISILYYVGGWFGIDGYLSGGSIIISIYLLSSLILNFYFLNTPQEEVLKLNIKEV